MKKTNITQHLTITAQGQTPPTKNIHRPLKTPGPWNPKLALTGWVRPLAEDGGGGGGGAGFLSRFTSRFSKKVCASKMIYLAERLTYFFLPHTPVGDGGCVCVCV